MNLKLSILYFIIGYILITLIGIGHTVFNWKVLDIENEKTEIKCMLDITAYAKTVPYHIIYNLIIFPIVAYFCQLQTMPENIISYVLQTSILWTAIGILGDLIGWVLIPHPWQCTFKDFYIDYQPWITLIYLVMFISPWIALIFR